MVYKKTKQKVRRVYSRGKSILNSNILKNPLIVGLAAGVAKNALEGKKIIDIENIKERISKVDGANPLIFLGLGILAKNPLITAIGLFRIIDPPNIEKNEEISQYSNVGENQELSQYLNIGENEESSEYSNIGETQELTGYSNVGESRKSVGYLNVRENEESTGYSNIGEIQKTEQKKRCVF